MPNKRKRKQNEKRKAQFKNYQVSNQAELNKLAKLERHTKDNPNDKQSQARAKPDNYTRKKPLPYFEMVLKGLDKK